MSKPSSFSRLALPIFRGTAMIIGALIGGVLGVFGFVHVISMDSWVYRYDASVMPRRYDALPLQGDEVLFQLIAQVLVSMGVRKEKCRHKILPGRFSHGAWIPTTELAHPENPVRAARRTCRRVLNRGMRFPLVNRAEMDCTLEMRQPRWAHFAVKGLQSEAKAILKEVSANGCRADEDQ